MKIARKKAILGTILAAAVLWLVILLAFLIKTEVLNRSKDKELIIREETMEYKNSNTVSVGEVAKHKTAKECWVGYNSKVYDVTRILSKNFEIKEESCGSIVYLELKEETERYLDIYEIANLGGV